MDKSTDIIAAFNAGKLPTQQQIDGFIGWLQSSGLTSVEPSSGGGELSAQGKVLVNGVRDILESYKQLGDSKNEDNILQEAIYHLTCSDIQNTSLDVDVKTDEASADAERMRKALRTLINVLWSNVSSEGSNLFTDFASLARLSLADAAELIEQQAGRAKEGLRQLDSQVEAGERDQLGRKRKSEGEQERDSDPKRQWESGMDAVKGVGSTVIETGQSASASAEETAEKTNARFQDAYRKVCRRAEHDPEYRSAISTLFDTVEKWVIRSIDEAADVNKDTNLESFINDPTPEQHTIKAIRALRTLVERLAGGKSLDDLFAATRTCAVDVRQDPDLKSYFQDFFAHTRESLDKPEYATSDEAKQKQKELSRRFKELTDADSDAGRKFKADFETLKIQLAELQERLVNDKDLERVRQAHGAFGSKLEDTMLAASGKAADEAASGLGAVVDHVSWMWQDLLHVYLPKFLGMLKDLPIPRTEFKDETTEFVLENLDISSFNLLPSHIYIRNITDVDIKTSETSSTTAVGTLTHIRIQAMQMELKDVSFYYNDKSASVAAEHTGIMAFTLPKQGIDVDLKLRMIPSTPAGLKERQKKGAFHVVEHVEVHIDENVDIVIRESNHSVMLAVFKPIAVMRVRTALEKALTEQIRSGINWLDAVAWDVGKRSEVFADTGLSTGPAYMGAIISEIGRLRKQSPGTSWEATGTGFIAESEGTQIAMGAEPQIISGEKHGPLATFSEPLKDKVERAANEMDIDVQGNANSAKGIAAEAKHQIREGVKQIKSFKNTIEQKVEKEKKTEGWKSNAFDV